MSPLVPNRFAAYGLSGGHGLFNARFDSRSPVAAKSCDVNDNRSLFWVRSHERLSVLLYRDVVNSGQEEEGGSRDVSLR